MHAERRNEWRYLKPGNHSAVDKADDRTNREHDNEDTKDVKVRASVRDVLEKLRHVLDNALRIVWLLHEHRRQARRKPRGTPGGKVRSARNEASGNAQRDDEADSGIAKQVADIG